MAPVKIACYSAFWGDSASAIEQFLKYDEPKLDYVVADYLAELTMGLLARSVAQGKKGFISEFLDLVVAPYLDLILKKKVKIVTNAGGLDPVGLKTAIEDFLQKKGSASHLKVAAVYGDNILPDLEALRGKSAFKAFDPLSGASTGERGFECDSQLLSLNAYLGAEPISQALGMGADIVVTGRCVDSALVLGPLAHEYGWSYSTTTQKALDRLASASLAGHIIECGAQATGGNFTDWKLSANTPHGGWANMGYPILSFSEDCTFCISKPDGTGGLVTRNSVCEQMLYEVHDPENYVLPDVVVDMSQVQLDQTSHGVVTIRGTKGKPPTPWLKCTAVEQKSYRITVDLLVRGDEAESKAQALGAAILVRTNALASKKFPEESPISSADSAIMLIGNESSYGVSTSQPERREVALRVAARHANRKFLDILGKETASFLTNSCPGICLLTSGRAKPTPNFTACSTLVGRESVVPKIQVTGTTEPQFGLLETKGCVPVTPSLSRTHASESTPQSQSEEGRLVPLHEVAVGRSGDKGDSANIAIIARDPVYYQRIKDQITSDAVFRQFAHFIAEGGTVTRFEVPGVHAVNFVLTRSLGGGGLSSLRLDSEIIRTIGALRSPSQPTSGTATGPTMKAISWGPISNSQSARSTWPLHIKVEPGWDADEEFVKKVDMSL